MSITLGEQKPRETEYERAILVNGKKIGDVARQSGRFRAYINFGNSMCVTAFGYGDTEQEAIDAAAIDAGQLIQLSIDRLAELRAALSSDESKSAA